jgi:hypothetical protein
MAVCTILFQKDILTASKHLVLKVTLIILTNNQFIQPPRILLLGAVILSSCVFILTNYFWQSRFFYQLLDSGSSLYKLVYFFSTKIIL